MRKKVVSMLLVVALAVSLAACGSSSKEESAEQAVQDLGDALENEDEDAAQDALQELDDLGEEKDESLDDTVSSFESYTADSRWADVKSNEFAMQYKEIFIKSGMKLSEVMEQINSSNTFSEVSPIPYEPDEIWDWDVIGKGIKKIYVEWDSQYKMTIIVAVGEETPVKDCYVLDAWIEDEAWGDCRWLNGSYYDILGMSMEDVEALPDTLFADVECESSVENKTHDDIQCKHYTYKVPYTNTLPQSDGEKSFDDCFVKYEYYVSIDTNEVVDYDCEISWRGYFESN